MGRTKSSGLPSTTMADQLSLRLEADQLPDLPDLRPMLPRPLPEPFDSDEHLFEPWWGGERALVSIGPADVVGQRRGADPGCGRRGRHGRTPRAGRAGRPCRRALGDPRRGAGRRRRRRSSRCATSWRGGCAASRVGRSRSSPSTCSTSTAGRCSRSRSSAGARRCGASSGRATRSSRCRPSRPRASRCSRRSSPRAWPGSWRASVRARTCRASAAGCGGSSRRRRRPGPSALAEVPTRDAPGPAAAPVLALISRLAAREDL